MEEERAAGADAKPKTCFAAGWWGMSRVVGKQSSPGGQRARTGDFMLGGSSA